MLPLFIPFRSSFSPTQLPYFRTITPPVHPPPANKAQICKANRKHSIHLLHNPLYPVSTASPTKRPFSRPPLLWDRRPIAGPFCRLSLGSRVTGPTRILDWLLRRAKTFVDNSSASNHRPIVRCTYSLQWGTFQQRMEIMTPALGTAALRRGEREGCVYEALPLMRQAGP